jgi:hypothetical protein
LEASGEKVPTDNKDSKNPAKWRPNSGHIPNYFVVGQTDVKSPHLNFTKIGSISPDPRDLLVNYPCMHRIC